MWKVSESDDDSIFSARVASIHSVPSLHDDVGGGGTQPRRSASVRPSRIRPGPDRDSAQEETLQLTCIDKRAALTRCTCVSNKEYNERVTWSRTLDMIYISPTVDVINIPLPPPSPFRREIHNADSPSNKWDSFLSITYLLYDISKRTT